MEFINLQIEKLKDIEYNLQFFLYSFTVFIVPLLMGHPQLLVGVIVNTALVLSAVYMDFKGTLPVILLPSLAVLSRGIIFGPYTVYLVYMIPFIWIGNAILVYSMKWLHLHMKKNYLLSMGAGAALKTAFLFGSAFILVSLKVLPVVFLTTMGMMQLTTALLGGAAAFGIIKARKLFF